MNKIDYQVLREKAEKATCGEWSLEYGESRFDCDDALIHRDVVGYLPICRIEGAHPESGFDEDFQMEQQANAEFIAAANPATVLALLDERERNQQYIKNRDQENEDIALTVGKLRVELEAAENNLIDSECHVAELEEALRDKQALLEASEKRIAELEAEPVSQAYKLNALDGNSPVTPDGWVIVPKKLTAENGAKGVLSGEFSETTFISCPECFGDDDCETCDGSGRIEIKVPVSWTTIKTIWAKGCEYFSIVAPQQDG
nr:MAG TPA: Ead/Ea22-like protein [Caudoviricetes sp.]